MGCYDRECELIEKGEAERGWAAQQYFAELDANMPEEASRYTHRPDYSRTLFAPEHDDIYREFCEYMDQDEPRFFDKIKDPITIEGYTAADIYHDMIANNFRVVGVDGAAVYNMLVKLRTQPDIALKTLTFKSSCPTSGCCG